MLLIVQFFRNLLPIFIKQYFEKYFVLHRNCYKSTLSNVCFKKKEYCHTGTFLLEIDFEFQKKTFKVIIVCLEIRFISKKQRKLLLNYINLTSCSAICKFYEGFFPTN